MCRSVTAESMNLKNRPNFLEDILCPTIFGFIWYIAFSWRNYLIYYKDKEEDEKVNGMSIQNIESSNLDNKKIKVQIKKSNRIKE